MAYRVELTDRATSDLDVLYIEKKLPSRLRRPVGSTVLSKQYPPWKLIRAAARWSAKPRTRAGRYVIFFMARGHTSTE
jgi:mRNA-degrading endonuclease RelE of RelBE toxin-antitoxin system